MSDDPKYTAQTACVLPANLASFALDFVARQMVQGQHLNWFIVEQLPVIAPERFERTMASLADTASESTGTSTGSVRTDPTETIAGFIRAEVLARTYTAHDMAPLRAIWAMWTMQARHDRHSSRTRMIARTAWRGWTRFS